MNRTRVKICGITRLEDARAAVDCGADALGFVFEPSSARCLRDPRIALEIMAKLPPFVQSVAVFAYLPENAESAMGGFDAIQSLNVPLNSDRRQKRIRAYRLQSEAEIAEIDPSNADALLLDAYSPSQYGGTGETCDWTLAARIKAGLPIPLILAGGLKAENVESALEQVRPYGVDVSSGVEASPGIKDPHKIEAFIRAVHRFHQKLR